MAVYGNDSFAPNTCASPGRPNDDGFANVINERVTAPELFRPTTTGLDEAAHEDAVGAAEEIEHSVRGVLLLEAAGAAWPAAGAAVACAGVNVVAINPCPTDLVTTPGAFCRVGLPSGAGAGVGRMNAAPGTRGPDAPGKVAAFALNAAAHTTAPTPTPTPTVRIRTEPITPTPIYLDQRHDLTPPQTQVSD